MYSLEELEKTFKKNALLCKQQDEKRLAEFITLNPGVSLPEWLIQDFCINTALAAMCNEILILKNRGGQDG